MGQAFQRLVESRAVLLLMFFRSIVCTFAAGKPARMCHHSRCDFLVMSADAVMAATRFFRAKRIEAAVGHKKILAPEGRDAPRRKSVPVKRICEFSTVHPFGNGNGRISRAIAEMALAQVDPHIQQGCSIAKQLMLEQHKYCRALGKTQTAGTPDITEFLAFFLGCLDRAIRSESARPEVLKKFPPPNSAGKTARIASLPVSNTMRLQNEMHIQRA